MSPQVLFTASTYSHISNFHLPYLSTFSHLGWTVHVACAGNLVDFPEKNHIIKLTFEKSLFSYSNFKAVKILRRTMKDNHYDLICVHTSLAAFFTRLAAKTISPRPPLVVVNHGYLFSDKPRGFREKLLLLAEKLVAKQTDLLLTMNQQDFLSARKNRLSRCIIEIPGMGVDFSIQDQIREENLHQLATILQDKDDNFLLLCVAEFSSRKNQAMLIKALPHLPQRVSLVFAGEGILLDHCRDLAKELKVEDRILFLGQVDDLSVWYATVDAMVSASRSEGLPFSIMEAMYAELPIVASKVKGHTDLICDKQTGLLYPYDDINSFVKQIIYLIDNPSLARQMGISAKNKLAPYELDCVLPQVMQLYLSIVDN